MNGRAPPSLQKTEHASYDTCSVTVLPTSAITSRET